MDHDPRTLLFIDDGDPFAGSSKKRCDMQEGWTYREEEWRRVRMSCEVWKISLGQEEVEWRTSSSCNSNSNCFSESYVNGKSYATSFTVRNTNSYCFSVSISHLCFDSIEANAYADAWHLHLSRRCWQLRATEGEEFRTSRFGNCAAKWIECEDLGL
jgi:hypothetical protein